MPESMLRPELVSLIHYVELDKAGWWEKSIQRLIVFAFWLDGGQLTLAHIDRVFKSEFSLELAESHIAHQVEQLCSVGVLVPLPANLYQLSEQSHREYEGRITEGQDLENRVESRFKKIFSECCPTLDIDEAWQIFHSSLLIPLIKEMGAKTYQLVSGSGPSVFLTTTFQEFLHGYAPELHQPLRDAVVRYLDPQNPDIRSYVLRHLNAYFFVEAASLKQATLDALTAAAKRKPCFKVFVDTNVLFSMVGIRENPSNESAQALLKLVERLSSSIEVKLYVLPHTIDEARLALIKHTEELRNWSLSPSLASAALGSGLSGFARSYAEEVVSAGHPVAASDYFDPYIENLMSFLREKGVKVYNANTDKYNMRPDVVDDILRETEYQKNNQRDSSRSYEQLEHDMVLWHFVSDQRPAAFESPIGAQYWIVTVDYRFLRFDSYKQRRLAHSVPVCLHPTALTQMLQFWIPRSDEFEAAVLGTLRLPFLFHGFDPEIERTTTDILRSMSRLDPDGDLSPDMAQRMFLNKGLRQKIAAEPSSDRHTELVREAIVLADKERAAQLQAANKKARHYESEAAAAAMQAKDLEKKLEDAKREAGAKLDKERAARESVESRLGDIEAALEEKQAADDRRRDVRRFRSRMAGYLILSLSVSVCVSLALVCFAAWEFRPLCCTVTSLSLILWLWLCDKIGSACKAICTSRSFVLFHKFRAWLFIPLAVAALAVCEGVAQDLWSSLVTAITGAHR